MPPRPTRVPIESASLRILAPDDDAAVDGELVQAVAHRRGRGALRTLDVAAPEPAPARERSRLRHRGERLAAAARRDRVHAVSSSRSIWSSTRSITRSTVSSTREFSITGTPAFAASFTR